MSKYIDTLIQALAYTAYMKLYRIEDIPLEKIEIHLSDKDNDWNSFAFSSEIPIVNVSDITIKDNQALEITKNNNSWNKLAIGLEADDRDMGEMPNK